MKAKLIVNPLAGGGRCGELLPLALKKLEEKKIEYDYSFTQFKGHGKELAEQAVKESYDLVVACGGDGTTNEVINALVGKEVALGILPLGMSNDYARNLGIKKRLDFACQVLKGGKVKKVDVVRVNKERYFGGVGGIGFDAEVTAWANQYVNKFLKGKASYIVAALAKLGIYKFKQVELNYDGGSFQGEIFLIAFGNTKSYGSGMQITPLAQIDDGFLDICLVRKINKFKILFLFPLVFKGNHTRMAEVKLYKSKTVSVESEVPLYLHGDGEFISQTPLFLEIVPQALQVMVPFIG